MSIHRSISLPRKETLSMFVRISHATLLFVHILNHSF